MKLTLLSFSGRVFTTSFLFCFLSRKQKRAKWMYQKVDKSRCEPSEESQRPLWSNGDPWGVTVICEKVTFSNLSSNSVFYVFLPPVFFFFLLSFLFSLTHWFIHTTCCTMAALLSKWDRLNGDLYFQDYICIQLQMIWRKRGQRWWRRRRRVVSILFLCLYE